ncbi:MAG TPA: hypothetical protein VNT79_19025 [Phycisphaerae bacterium]|nr:hypothetical protein [Phycisphaerae bacterium]
MSRTIRQTVRIQEGGRVEYTSRDLPAGAEADLIIVLHGENGEPVNPVGIFFDEAELLDEVVTEAMDKRSRPMRAQGE